MVDNEHCKECGNPVLVQIQKNTGFCCVKHEETYKGKPPVESEVTVARTKKGKKGNRIRFAREGHDTVLGYYYEPGALKWDKDKTFVVSLENSQDVENVIGKATKIKVDNEGWYTAKVEWLDERGEDIAERLGEDAFMTIFARELFTEGNIPSGSIRVTSLKLVSLFVNFSPVNPWGDPE